MIELLDRNNKVIRHGNIIGNKVIWKKENKIILFLKKLFTI